MVMRRGAAIAAAASLLSVAAFAQEAPKLSDAQIAHIAYTAGQIDIDAATQALAKSKNEDIRSFAQEMVRDHTAVNKQVSALVTKLNMAPQDNDTGRALGKEAKEERDKLAKLNGAEFDTTYIANEVAYHKTVNSALETTLIPDATNPQLKNLLQISLKLFQGHQEHAEHLAASLK